MTRKRDLKQRVRERQAETGESYVTALRHVQAQVPPEEPAERAGAIPVVELIDLTEAGEPLGFKCRIAMAPTLVGLVEPITALVQLRDLLLATTNDRNLDLMRDVLLRGLRLHGDVIAHGLDSLHQFLERARAGLGGVSEGGRVMALHMDGTQGGMMVLFMLSMMPPRGFVPTRYRALLTLGPVPRDEDADEDAPSSPLTRFVRRWMVLP
jgi:hypothetical protein